MNLKSNNFADNPKKQSARDFLLRNVKYNFAKNPSSLNMLELLGTGVGANYYLQHMEKLGHIDCVERDKSQFLGYKPTDDRVSVYNKDLCKFVRENHDKIYDVINLDFCSFFYEGEMKKAIPTGHIVKEIFDSKNFKVGSMIFVTFTLEGIFIALSKYKENISSSIDYIKNRIVEIAKMENVDLTPLEDEYVYRSGDRGWNKMMHTGFIVNAM